MRPVLWWAVVVVLPVMVLLPSCIADLPVGVFAQDEACAQGCSSIPFRIIGRDTMCEGGYKSVGAAATLEIDWILGPYSIDVKDGVLSIGEGAVPARTVRYRLTGNLMVSEDGVAWTRFDAPRAHALRRAAAESTLGACPAAE